MLVTTPEVPLLGGRASERRLTDSVLHSQPLEPCLQRRLTDVGGTDTVREQKQDMKQRVGVPALGWRLRREEAGRLVGRAPVGFTSLCNFF